MTWEVSSLTSRAGVLPLHTRQRVRDARATSVPTAHRRRRQALCRRQGRVLAGLGKSVLHMQVS